MRVALVYDEPITKLAPENHPEDFGAEYEEVSAINTLLVTIEENNHEAIPVPFDERFMARIRAISPDLVFNIAEGVYGPARESIVPAWLDHLQIPYTGSDGLTLAVTLDKALTKSIIAAQGVQTPDFKRISNLSQLNHIDFQFPLFVKPNAEGSSMGIRHASCVHTKSELIRQVDWVLREYHQDCLVEEFAPGPEFCVGILGNNNPRLLPVAEIQAPGSFYAYEEKSQHIKALIFPAMATDEPDEIICQMGFIGMNIYRMLRCRDLARIDFKIDTKGNPSFLEINPLPGLAYDYGIFPRQAEAGGISYKELIGSLIQMAIDRA